MALASGRKGICTPAAARLTFSRIAFGSQGPERSGFPSASRGAAPPFPIAGLVSASRLMIVASCKPKEACGGGSVALLGAVCAPRNKALAKNQMVILVIPNPTCCTLAQAREARTTSPFVGRASSPDVFKALALGATAVGIGRPRCTPVGPTLHHPRVTSESRRILAIDAAPVLVINRKPGGLSHPKLHEIVHVDFFNLAPIEQHLIGFNACFFCLGVSSVGMSNEEYKHITYDLTLNIAQLLATVNPEMTFCYVTGAGTYRSEQ